jgi:site-specific DNA-cytosine methylase
VNVLSLFDGMSCGQIALNRLGIDVENYYASEIDKYAIKVTQKNYPNTIQLGDIKNVKGEDLPNIDLLLAGSPCQGFSFAGKQLAFDDPRSALFFEFIRLLKDIKPKYFLLENVRMKKEYLDVITDLVGVEPILINSALVSSQNRLRYYWTNLPVNGQPEDKGLVLRDILDPNVTNSLSYPTAMRPRTQRNVREASDKSNALTATAYKGSQSNGVTVVKSSKINMIGFTETRWRVLTPIECERLQNVPDNFTECVSNTQRYKMLGNGWTVDVICHILKGLLKKEVL